MLQKTYSLKQSLSQIPCPSKIEKKKKNSVSFISRTIELPLIRIRWQVEFQAKLSQTDFQCVCCYSSSLRKQLIAAELVRIDFTLITRVHIFPNFKYKL